MQCCPKMLRVKIINKHILSSYNKTWGCPLCHLSLLSFIQGFQQFLGIFTFWLRFQSTDMFALCVSLSLPLIGPELAVLGQWEDSTKHPASKLPCALFSPPHPAHSLTQTFVFAFSHMKQRRFTQVPTITVIRRVRRQACAELATVSKCYHKLVHKDTVGADSMRADKQMIKQKNRCFFYQPRV